MEGTVIKVGLPYHHGSRGKKGDGSLYLVERRSDLSLVEVGGRLDFIFFHPLRLKEGTPSSRSRIS